MEAQQQLARLQLSDDDGPRDWASLPLDLLRLCIAPLKGDRATKAAALATCKAFSRAAVRTTHHGSLILSLDRPTPFQPSTRIWRELWGEEQPQQGQVVNLMLGSSTLETPVHCLGELLSAGERLPMVTRLTLWGLCLDVILAPGVSALLPNLQQLILHGCILTPAARTTLLDAGCSSLCSLSVEDSSAQADAAPQLGSTLQQLATAQLRQLAKLPSLSSVTLKDSSCPTLFLVALGTQLTSLELHESYRQCEPGTLTPMPTWRATLQHVARCTGLRAMSVPCHTAEELGLVAPGLQQLRTLWLSCSDHLPADGDAMVELLLGLPHLTSLTWPSCPWHVMRRSFVDRSCCWEQLTLTVVIAQHLARLPLYSLKQPLRWSLFMVPEGTGLHEVRVAVANVTRRCPAGFDWRRSPCLMFNGVEIDVFGVLRALQPLLAPLTSVRVSGIAWSAPLVRLLGEVLPRTCTCLALSQGLMGMGVLEQVARSLPWLQSLQLKEQQVPPDDVVGFVRLARRLKREGGGTVRLEEVVVTQPPCPEGVSEAQHKRAWERAERAVQKRKGGLVRFRLEW